MIVTLYLFRGAAFLPLALAARWWRLERMSYHRKKATLSRKIGFNSRLFTFAYNKGVTHGGNYQEHV
jgi:hypothetical protein